MASHWGPGAKFEVDSGHHPHEARYLKLDISKARNQMGWMPRLRLHEALEWTVTWSRGRQNGRSVRDMTLEQIRNYQTRIEQIDVDD